MKAQNNVLLADYTKEIYVLSVHHVLNKYKYISSACFCLTKFVLLVYVKKNIKKSSTLTSSFHLFLETSARTEPVWSMLASQMACSVLDMREV